VEIGLFYHNKNPKTGPGKLALNLIQGLKSLGITVKPNQICKYNGCLQPTNYELLPSDTLMGPNLVILPDEQPYIWQKFSNFVVPSIWVKNKYKSFEVTKNTNINVWSVGIDTNQFSAPDKQIEFDCLVYYKNSGEEKLRETEDRLKSLGLDYRIIGYGLYTEEQFLDLLQKCRFCVLVTKTESQGIAYMEILSTNTPCYVYDKQEWDDIPPYTFAATSAPYFSGECGMISPDLNSLENFINKLDIYEPRSYIINEHRLDVSAKKYLKLLREEEKKRNESQN